MNNTVKFYVIEISEGDTKIKGKAMYEYDNKNSAIATFHKKLGTAMASDLYATEQIMVVNSNNVVICCEKYINDDYATEEPTEE